MHGRGWPTNFEKEIQKTKIEEKKASTKAKNTTYRQMYACLETKEGENGMFKIARAAVYEARPRGDQVYKGSGWMCFSQGTNIKMKCFSRGTNIKMKWKKYFHDLFNGGESLPRG